MPVSLRDLAEDGVDHAIDQLPIDPVARELLKVTARNAPGVVEAIACGNSRLAKRRLYEATYREIDRAIALERLRQREGNGE
jgi:hypothetical protein